MKIKVKNRIYDNHMPYADDSSGIKMLANYMLECGFGYWNSDDLRDLWEEVSEHCGASWLFIPESLEEFKYHLSSIATYWENDEEECEYCERKWGSL